MRINRRKFIKSAAALSGAAMYACSGADETEKLQPFKKPISPITEQEREQRIERARELMHQNNIDALFVESGSSLFYFTGIRWGRSERMFAWILPVNGPAAFVCPAFEMQKASEQIPENSDVRSWEEHENPHLRVQQILNDRGLTRAILAAEETVRYFLIDGLRRQMPYVTITSADPVIGECRQIKSAAEIGLMQSANDITVNAYDFVLRQLKPGKNQHQVAEEISDAFKELGVRGGAFVQFGKYSAFPHGSDQLQELKEGDVVLIDGGCSVEGYRSDISRSVIYGEPEKKQQQIWDLILEAQKAVLKIVRPGIRCEEVDQAARKIITDAGFGPDYKFFSHRLGHGIGLDGHERPYLVRGNHTILKPGMCFSNEPGIYIYGEFGIRLEDCMYVTEDGGKLFSDLSPSIVQPFA